MVDLDIVTAKLAELTDQVERIRQKCPADVDGLQTDRDAREIVSFNLMLAVQSSTDIASHLISDEGWPPAKDLADAFRRLHDKGVLSRETSDALARATGLRNVVAHVYSQADPELLFRGATDGLEDLERFSREVARWVGSRRGS